MPRPNIWNSKALDYSSGLTYDDFLFDPKDAKIIRSKSPINKGSEKGWSFKNLVTKDIGSDKIYLAQIYFDRGGGHNYHAHTCDEIVYLLQGIAQFTYRSKGGKDIANELKPGDTAFCPAGTPHSLWNAGEGACAFLVIKSPPYFLEQIPLSKEVLGKKLFPRKLKPK